MRSTLARQGIEPPADDEVERDQREEADHGDRRERVDQQDDRRGEPDRADPHRRRAKADSKGWGPPHRQAQADDADRHDGQPGHEEHVEDPLVALPHGREHRPLGVGSARSVVEVRKPDRGGMRQRAGGKHGQANDADHARKRRHGRSAVAKRAIEHEQRCDPQDESGEVEAVLDRPSRANGRKAADRRIRPDDQAHEDEHEDEEDGASQGGQPAPSILLTHRQCPPRIW